MILNILTNKINNYEQLVNQIIIQIKIKLLLYEYTSIQCENNRSIS